MAHSSFEKNYDNPPTGDPRDPSNNTKYDYLFEGQESYAEKSLAVALTVSAVDGPIPAADLVAGGVLAAAIIRDESVRIHVTYTLINAEGKIYVGRTSGFDTPYNLVLKRYNSHHMKKLGYKNPVVDKAAIGIGGRSAIRGREQQLADYYGGVGSKNLGNIIRPVSKWNPLGKIYHTSSSTHFGEIHKFTGNPLHLSL